METNSDYTSASSWTASPLWLYCCCYCFLCNCVMKRTNIKTKKFWRKETFRHTRSKFSGPWKTGNLHQSPVTQNGCLDALLSGEILISRGKLWTLCEKRQENNLTQIEMFWPTMRVNSSKKVICWPGIQKLQFSPKTTSSVTTFSIKVLTIYSNNMDFSLHQGCPWAHEPSKDTQHLMNMNTNS